MKNLRGQTHLVAILDDSWEEKPIKNKQGRKPMRKANSGDACVSPGKQKKGKR